MRFVDPYGILIAASALLFATIVGMCYLWRQRLLELWASLNKKRRKSQALLDRSTKVTAPVEESPCHTLAPNTPSLHFLHYRATLVFTAVMFFVLSLLYIPSLVFTFGASNTYFEAQTKDPFAKFFIRSSMYHIENLDTSPYVVLLVMDVCVMMFYLVAFVAFSVVKGRKELLSIDRENALAYRTIMLRLLPRGTPADDTVIEAELADYFNREFGEVAEVVSQTTPVTNTWLKPTRIAFVTFKSVKTASAVLTQQSQANRVRFRNKRIFLTLAPIPSELVVENMGVSPIEVFLRLGLIFVVAALCAFFVCAMIVASLSVWHSESNTIIGGVTGMANAAIMELLVLFRGFERSVSRSFTQRTMSAITSMTSMFVLTYNLANVFIYIGVKEVPLFCASSVVTSFASACFFDILRICRKILYPKTEFQTSWGKITRKFVWLSELPLLFSAAVPITVSLSLVLLLVYVALQRYMVTRVYKIIPNAIFVPQWLLAMHLQGVFLVHCTWGIGFNAFFNIPGLHHWVYLVCYIGLSVLSLLLRRNSAAFFMQQRQSAAIDAVVSTASYRLDVEC